MTAAIDTGTQRRDGVWVFGRQEFAENRFDYKAGDHVLFGGPTQHGKTTLAFELLQYCATPTLPAYVAVSKPRDPTTEKWGRKLGFRRVSDWPVPRQVKEYWQGGPPGYLIWPKFGDMHTDMQRCAYITEKLLQERYAAGVRNKHGILVIDDTMTKSKLMGLDSAMVTILAMASAMGIGMWVFVQKPTDSGRTAIWSYGASEHVFLCYDPDRANQKRYDEIGGVDPKLVAGIVNSLEPYQFLYIRRSTRAMCIVDAK